MQQSKRTAAVRVILGTLQSLYFWLSIGLRWPKRKGATEHVLTCQSLRGRGSRYGLGGRILQIGHPCRDAAVAPSPLCPRSLLRETECIQTRSHFRILHGRRSAPSMRADYATLFLVRI